ncbi:MAG: cereblon family protein [Desulfobulbaceae bacterium]|nr:cereblon family protein [Desulfobulbaceae bacterium]
MPAATKLTEPDRQPQDPGLRRVIRCAACAASVTSEDQAIAVDHGHTHTFPNPHGLVFTIRCFATATGCLTHGAATPEFSWFAGYRWRLALCRECLTHLGWQYLGNGDAFFGLIVAKLRSET